MDTRHPGFTTLQTIRPEITMNINNATICPEITRIRLVQNLISHLVDNYPRSRMLKKTPRDHYFCSCHAPRSPQLENNAKRVRNTAPRSPDLDLECTCYCLSREAYSDSSRSPHLGHTAPRSPQNINNARSRHDARYKYNFELASRQVFVCAGALLRCFVAFVD